MKTIRVLRSTGNNLPHFTEGQVVDVRDDVADLLAGMNLAEVLKAVPEEPLRTVADNPSIQAVETRLIETKERWIAGKASNEPSQQTTKPKRQHKQK